MTGRPALSVLVLSWNCWDDLKRCLQSVFASGYQDYEVLVVENASTDGTRERLPREFPLARVIQNDENLGHTGGFNQGVQLTRGDRVLLLDADTEFDTELIGNLMSFMENQPLADVVCPRLYYADGQLQETARNFPSAMSGLFGRQSWLTRKFPGNPFSRRYLLRHKLSERAPYRVQSVSAACIMFDRGLVDEVGAWDESYPGYWVDVDWCFRLHETGKRIFCVPTLSVIHHESNRRDRRRGPRRIWMFNYGAYLLYRKHYTAGLLDPRAMAAYVLLSARTALQILMEWLQFSVAGPNQSRVADSTPDRRN